MTISDIVLEFATDLKTILGQNLSKIILYGSYARMDYDASSDVDIMILVTLSDEEIKKVSSDEKIKNSDVVVIGICNAIIYDKQVNLVNEITKAVNGKTVVIVAMDSPYDAELFKDAKNFVCTYGVSADSMYAAVDYMRGKLTKSSGDIE